MFLVTRLRVLRTRCDSRPAASSRVKSRPLQVEALEDRTLLSGWVLGFGSSSTNEGGNAIALDSLGSSYVTGHFAGTVDFDTGPGVANLTASGLADIFIAKYSGAGTLQWARRAGGSDSSAGDAGNGIVDDGSGNVYVTGAFFGVADFGPISLTSIGGQDSFAAKLDASGNFLWAVSAGSTGTDRASGLALDASGNSYVTGWFRDTTDFDPGPGTFNLTSGGANDAYVWKLDSNGNLVWAVGAGANNPNTCGGLPGGGDLGRAIAVDGFGNVWSTGRFTGTVDFDPGPGTVIVAGAGCSDSYVWKLDAAGNYLWAGAIGSSRDDEGFGIASDAAGNIYASGQFTDTADFDPGPGSSMAAGPGGYVLKLDNSANFVWARQSGADNYDAVAVDGNSNVYARGGITGVVDFDPGPGAGYLGTPGVLGVVVWKLDSSGNFGWVRRLGYGGSELGTGVAVDSSGAVYSTAHFDGQADFDIGSAVSTLTSNGGSDIFIAKTTQDVPTTPQLGALTDTPDPVSNKGSGVVTLTVRDIRFVVGGSSVASVTFYRDKNGNGVLDLTTDTLLGTDTNGSNGGSLGVPIPKNFATGKYTYFAQAKDSANVVGNVVSTINSVSKNGAIAAIVAIRDPIVARFDLAIARFYSNHSKNRDFLLPAHLNRHKLAALLS